MCGGIPPTRNIVGAKRDAAAISSGLAKSVFAMSHVSMLIPRNCSAVVATGSVSTSTTTGVNNTGDAGSGDVCFNDRGNAIADAEFLNFAAVLTSRGND